MEILISYIAFIVLIPSSIIFYELTKLMHHETRGSNLKFKAELLIFSGCWVFSKSYFNKGLDTRFLVGRICLILITVSIFLIFKFYKP